MNNLLTTAQAAKKLGITPNLLRQWVYRKKIKQVYPGLFDPNDIQTLAASPSQAIRRLIQKDKSK